MSEQYSGQREGTTWQEALEPYRDSVRQLLDGPVQSFSVTGVTASQTVRGDVIVTFCVPRSEVLAWLEGT